MQLKQYVGVVRDHSASMRGMTQGAMRDYNEGVRAIQAGSRDNSIDTIISTIKCGVGYSGSVVRDVVNSNVQVLQPMTSYLADGHHTPLFDSVGELIEIFQSMPDAGDDRVSFLINAVTDGEENSSDRWKTKLGIEIRRLQATDRWTFVFRVPRGYADKLSRSLGVPVGNIHEWDTSSERGLIASTQTTTDSYASFYKARATGVKSTGSFFAGAAHLTPTQVKRSLTDVSKSVVLLHVPSHDDGIAIRDFVERHLGTYQVGAGHYELTKREKAVQDYKVVYVRHRQSGAVYTGADARQMLGVPLTGTTALLPGDMGDWQVFIQSTSANRKLVGGTTLLYKAM